MPERLCVWHVLVVIGIMVKGEPAQRLAASAALRHHHDSTLCLAKVLVPDTGLDGRINRRLRGGEDTSTDARPPSQSAVRKASYMLSKSADAGDLAKLALSLKDGADVQ